MLTSWRPFGFRGLLDDVFPTRDDILPGLYDNAEPPVNARENETALMLDIDVPRYRADELTVESNNNTGIVTVTGHRSPGAFEDAMGVYPHLLYGQAAPTQFRRSFRLARKGYDLQKVTHTLDHGVLRITIPKVPTPPPPQALTLYDGAHPTLPDGTVATVDVETSDGAVRHLQKTRWPPVTKVEETDKEWRYTFNLPKQVHHQNLKLQLIGSQLTLQIHAGHSDKGDGLGSRYVTFSQSFMVPKGTTADQIHTKYEPGVFAITIDKVPATGAAPKATQDVPVTTTR
jgi:HSP20 family molecular chaperone IbpA